MAVSISNTKHYKKGEKLPDGTTAKRGVVWNTKTGKRVTGTVTMTSAAGVAAKKYKGGRSVTSIKRAADKKATPSPKSRIASKTGSGSSSGSGSGSGGGATAAQKALEARLKQNKGVKAGTVRVGAAGKGTRRYNAKTGRWDRITGTQGVSSTTNQNQNQSGRRTPAAGTPGTTASQTKPKPTYQAGTGGGSSYNALLSKARTRKYGPQTPGNAAMSAIGGAVSSVFSSRPDSVVAAKNKRLADERRARQAAAKAAIKAAAERNKQKGKW